MSDKAVSNCNSSAHVTKYLKFRPETKHVDPLNSYAWMFKDDLTEDKRYIIQWHGSFSRTVFNLDIRTPTSFNTPPHFSVGVLCYTFRCLSVRRSIRPCSPFPIDNLSIYSRNFLKFCIHIVIGDEWYGIVNGQNPSIFNGVTALFRIGKMVSGLLFLYCS